MTNDTHTPHTDSSNSPVLSNPPTIHPLLSLIGRDYEGIQRRRTAIGNTIFAHLNNQEKKEPGWLASLGYGSPAEVLSQIKKGNIDNIPNTYLCRTYALALETEKYIQSQMEGELENHPVWDWMQQVRGIGPTLAARLLGRLDLDKTHNASSFAGYCGLREVPGKLFRCPDCGHEDVFVSTYNVTGKHKRRDTKATCPTLSVQVAGPEDGVRAAMPAVVKGEKPQYDIVAKKICYLIGTQFLKSGDKSWYATQYRDKRRYYDIERPGWSDARKHYGALRRIQKLFLSHLWEAWMLAVGRDPVPGNLYVIQRLGHSEESITSAYEVLEWEHRQKQAA